MDTARLDSLSFFSDLSHRRQKQVADMMIKNPIHRVFVTQGGKVVGIISTPDMLKTIRNM
jgi:predicted transcriptional regulator